MAEQHLSTREEVSSLVDVAYEHWEKKTKRRKESHTRFAFRCGSYIFEQLLNRITDLWLMLQSKFCIFIVESDFRRGYAKDTHCLLFNIVRST